MSTTSFTHEFNTESFKGKVSFPTGVFIDGKFSAGGDNTTIDVINPTNGKVITSIAEGTAADVDRAVQVAKRTYEKSWGLNVPGAERGRLLNRLADLMEKHFDELAALEALDNGKTFNWAKAADLTMSVATIRYYAGWADKIHGQVIETSEDKLAYTRHEPFGVVGQIIPWNFPLMMMSWKLGPALATGNTIVLKPSEFTPLTALRMCTIINEAGFPPGTVNVIVGYGNTVGQAISEHMGIDKVAFTGSTLVGRKVMEAAAKSNLKNVTLELGGKSPNIVMNDADLETAVNWSSHGIFWNHGQACCAGSRIFVQSGIYDKFLKAFTEKTLSLKLGDPFAEDSYQGPQVSKIQYDRIMDFIDSGKKQGAKVHVGGERFGHEGYWIQPTIFTNTTPDMRIVQEEIFGPVGVVIKFEDEEDVLRQANDTLYGLAAAVFTKDITRGIQFAHKLQAGTAWINCVNQLHPNVPFGGYKQSGVGRELGEYALNNYTNVKAVHVNLGHTI
ncbi:aldehyde dehydrogenase [Artomyces pyxidatus]|uniref:Aldehyde dehydrogenase n=1 Tax=Artomyces pyxidatus TaxID=48021 RepID=A0ACB8SUF9_9AGAM|nr:aldehyde dehydrogenase [Artomyces pyxidatus]